VIRLQEDLSRAGIELASHVWPSAAAVLPHLASGKTNTEIAAELVVEPSQVSKDLRLILEQAQKALDIDPAAIMQPSGAVIDEQPTHANVGSVINRMRADAGLDTADLARALDKSPATLWRFFAGKSMWNKQAVEAILNEIPMSDATRAVLASSYTRERQAVEQARRSGVQKNPTVLADPGYAPGELRSVIVNLDEQLREVGVELADHLPPEQQAVLHYLGTDLDANRIASEIARVTGRDVSRDQVTRDIAKILSTAKVALGLPDEAIPEPAITPRTTSPASRELDEIILRTGMRRSALAAETGLSLESIRRLTKGLNPDEGWPTMDTFERLIAKLPLDYSKQLYVRELYQAVLDNQKRRRQA
jgi:AcrR family transcriptional regulator